MNILHIRNIPFYSPAPDMKYQITKVTFVISCPCLQHTGTLPAPAHWQPVTSSKG